jgi:hypothetical protein
MATSFLGWLNLEKIEMLLERADYLSEWIAERIASGIVVCFAYRILGD